jgi:hypothetical protein
LINPVSGKKEITSFPEGFMTLRNPKILSVSKKLKYVNTTPSKTTKYFDIGRFRFDIYEEVEDGGAEQPKKINEPYFALNPLTPMIISTRERLLGAYTYEKNLEKNRRP